MNNRDRRQKTEGKEYDPQITQIDADLRLGLRIIRVG